MYAVLLGIDIEDFSQDTNTTALLQKRNTLSSYLFRASNGYNKFDKDNYVEGGDGGYFIIETGDFLPLLQFVQRISDEFNNSKTIRARCIIHIGTVEKAPQLLSDSTSTFVGDGINSASRYLNAGCLKELLKINTNEFFVFGMSNDFFDKVYKESYYVKDDYIRYSFKEKKYCSIIHLKTDPNFTLPSQDQVTSIAEAILDESFKEQLSQSEFTYRNDGKLSDLNTFFVFPDLLIDDINSKYDRLIDAEILISNYLMNPRNILIAGGDQSGKTSLGKVFFSKLYDSRQYLPIYICFSSREKGMIANKISNARKSQYPTLTDFEGYLSVIILDDFYLLDDKQQRKILSDLESMKNTYVIIMVDSIYNSSLEKRSTTELLTSYSIREFGHGKRKELIEKWIEFNELCDENYCDTDSLSEYVDLTLIKGLIPYTPFYILTVLAAKIDFVPLNGELTSKGHCYQALIYISLRKLGIPDSEIGAFLNILSFIGYSLFSNNNTSISPDDLEDLIDEYAETYNLSFEKEYLIKRFDSSSVFHRNSLGIYTFHASYLLHYFIAKYLAEHLDKALCYKAVEDIYNNLQDSKNAYIGIFIVHHSKDIRILDEILLNTMILYDQYPEATLSKKEMLQIDDFAKRLNSEVIEEYDLSSEKRKTLLSEKDQQEIQESKSETEEIAINEELTNLKKAIRTVEVMGQILKNHSGEIEKKKIKECFLNAFNAYRRICSHFLNEFTKSEKDFAEYIVERIVQLKNNTYTREQIYEFAQNIFGVFSISSIYVTVKRSADALGSKEMIKIVKEVTEEIDNPLAYCVYLQSLMWYRKEVPIDELKHKYKDLPPTVQHIVQRLIKEYSDLHHIKHAEKQQIASTLGMRLESLEYDHTK